MKVVDNDFTYIVSWNHIRDPEEIKNLCPGKNYSVVTVCSIIPVADSEACEQGFSFCLPEDQFNKEFGRKASLTRALEGFEEEFRTLVWKTYFSR